jgi:hypothetical protein
MSARNGASVLRYPAAQHRLWKRIAAFSALAVLVASLCTWFDTPTAAAAPTAAVCGCAGAFVSPSVAQVTSRQPAAPDRDGFSEAHRYRIAASNDAANATIIVTKGDTDTRVLELTMALADSPHWGFSPDGTKLVTYGTDFGQLWDLATPNHKLWQQNGAASGYVFSVDSGYLAQVTGSGTGGSAVVVDTTTGASQLIPQDVDQFGFSPDGKRFLHWSNQNAELVDLPTGHRVWSDSTPAATWAFGFSANGRFLEVVQTTHTVAVAILLIDTTDGTRRWSTDYTFVPAPAGTVVTDPGGGTQGFSPDGSTFVEAHRLSNKTSSSWAAARSAS